ncbi:N-acetylglucosamine-6-phosphate deacetylase [Massiliimalia massiliensis]|uniref:N-acetylglucosamine-6-phosphate deacetylase n=1 Tax=Massiliimalia massiliensis TaxID=1852384 RepID=UPI0009863411|nr:N-acetylglucosamine-6-phosphate deacetylase [Massiliimalia massiliensis]
MIFQNASVFYRGTFQRLDLKTNGALIEEIAPHIPGKPALDCSGKLLIPGLIDIHTHGCVGFDFSTASPEEMETMLKYYQKNGITSVCATTMTMPSEGCRRAARNIAGAAKQAGGSRIIGINMEGPFLSRQRKGAHDEQYLTAPDKALLDEFNRLSGGLLKIINLAPELDGAMKIIDDYHSEKVISIAHTACGYETALEAFDRGADHITHLFNAMNGLHHRDPGIIGALSDRDVFAELICDGIHIHPAVIRLMFRLCAAKMVMISDSMCACGLSDGQYQLGGLDVTVVNRKATLSDGTIAGSSTNVYQGMRNVIGFGVPAEQAILSATLLPAKSIRCDSDYGSLEVGKHADLLLLDQDYQVEAVYQDGNLSSEL